MIATTTRPSRARVRALPMLAAAVLLLAAAPARAASTTLDSLLGGDVFTSGDLMFSNFAYSPNTNAPAAAGITVLAVDRGIKFAVPLLQVGPGNIDFDITYDVMGAGPLSPATLTSIGHGSGGGFVTIIENINHGNTLVASLNNHFINSGGWNFDQANLPPLAKLTVSTDVGLAGGNGVATLSDWTQRFGPVSAIPTPAAGLGGVVLLSLIIAQRIRGV